jgi:hypothetical protein
MDSAFWFSFVNINKQVSPSLVVPLFAVHVCANCDRVEQCQSWI